MDLQNSKDNCTLRTRYRSTALNYRACPGTQTHAAVPVNAGLAQLAGEVLQVDAHHKSQLARDAFGMSG